MIGFGIGSADWTAGSEVGERGLRGASRVIHTCLFPTTTTMSMSTSDSVPNSLPRGNLCEGKRRGEEKKIKKGWRRKWEWRGLTTATRRATEAENADGACERRKGLTPTLNSISTVPVPRGPTASTLALHDLQAGSSTRTGGRYLEGTQLNRKSLRTLSRSISAAQVPLFDTYH